ncbi:MAG TPA: PEP/pyruvate-binding domain-containing protein, partial [Xanthobacteraceae bacterium]
MAKKSAARRSRTTAAARRAVGKVKRKTNKPNKKPARAAKPSRPAVAKPSRSTAVPAARSGKWVYTFGDGKAEGRAQMKNLLGGKGANLAEMANLGLPVPPGFTITTDVCT